MKATFADKAIDFYSTLKIDAALPGAVSVLDPYADPEVQSVVRKFFEKFYHEGEERIIVLGINPGRFGAGVTGITFTDPERLQEVCGIPNTFEKRSELSSRFVYELIEALGGTQKFFSRYYLSAVCPLGFVRSGRNLNYYDDRDLENTLGGFILESLSRQLEMGVKRDRAICLGEGKNLAYLQKINKKARLFREIEGLPHPRWVMQYRFKSREKYIQSYLSALSPNR